MTFIIAEVGSNWTSFEDASNSITMAKSCGADAVKFQLYTHSELYGTPDHLGMATELPLDWLFKLAAKAKATGIEFMCTAFSPRGVVKVDPFVNRHKIASSELSYPELLDAVKATGKPILLSTGGHNLEEIGLALERLKGADVTLMYCVSAYPAKNVDLEGITMLEGLVQNKAVGYSCHEDGYTSAVYAVCFYDVPVIEKHFKLRDMDTPDAPHSLLPDDFRRMVQKIRGDTTVRFPDPQEQPTTKYSKRRCIVTAPIKAGERLEYGKNFGVYRSLTGKDSLNSWAAEKINGAPVKVDLSPGDGILGENLGL
jgi:sialic acid synthase SpsE